MDNAQFGRLQNLYMIGVPGNVGGGSTKFLHLIRLLRDDFRITVVLPHVSFRGNKQIKRLLEPLGVPFALLKELPKKLDGIALGMCVLEFFSSGMANEVKERGLRLIWSNEMMWPFKGEAEAVNQGIIDRVLYTSQFQADVFDEMYKGVSSSITGNYIDALDYPWHERTNAIFKIGRLSRPDLSKYPLDFPVFYEELELQEVCYRVMGWSNELHKQYRWHHFGPKWNLLPPDKEPAVDFLNTLDLFVYPLGHRFKESWGRAVVEAMLTGCVPVVPAGHQFHSFIVHGESGFICTEFREYKACVQELYKNYSFRRQMSKEAAKHAREQLCDPAQHRRVWVEALTT